MTRLKDLQPIIWGSVIVVDNKGNEYNIDDLQDFEESLLLNSEVCEISSRSSGYCSYIEIYLY